jgi:hypothetical protein
MVAFTGNGDHAKREVLDVPEVLTLRWLHQTWAGVMGTIECRSGMVELGSKAIGLYLPDHAIPETAVRLGIPHTKGGRWLTATIHLGAHRAYVSPELFLRQRDLDGDHAWLAVSVLRIEGHLEPRGREFPDGSALYEWGMFGVKYYYFERLGRWGVYGGGNTPPRKLEAVAKSEESAEAYLWSVGAVRIGP